MARGGLGRGLGALLPSMANFNPQDIQDKNNNKENNGEPKEIPVVEITENPHQPRKIFSTEALQVLADSIKQYGVLQPVLVRKKGNRGYELIAGERRLRAAKMAGLETVPAVFREYNDAQMTEVALIENIQRENLNAIEEAKAYDHLLVDYGLTQDMLSQKIGRSRSHIANFLRLLKLSKKVQDMLEAELLSMGQAKPLLSIEDEPLQEKAAEYVADNDLSARKVEALVKQLVKNPHLLDEKEKEIADHPEPLINGRTKKEVQDQLKVIFNTDVKIRNTGKKRSIEINAVDDHELQRILALLTKFV